MSDSSDEELFLLDSVLPKILILLGKRKNVRTIGVQEINKRRKEEGEYRLLFHDLKENPSRLQSYLGMNLDTFHYILEKIEPEITKIWGNWHQPIMPEERLVITLRFLATGLSFQTLAFDFRVGASTVAQIVSETVTALWDELKPVHMPTPTHETFQTVSDNFYNLWNFPNCLGTIDGKHVRIRYPSQSGLMSNNNDKKYFSILLQAVVDANYKFVAINVGGLGKLGDGDTFQASSFYHALVESRVQLPEPSPLPNSNVVAPYVFVGDGAYPLMTHLLKPYSGTNLTLDEDCFNERLSTCRKTVESAFGILMAKWRLLTQEIETNVELANRIIKSMCVLHNTIIDKEGMDQTLTEVSIEGQSMVGDRIGKPGNEAKSVRDLFKEYFSNPPLKSEALLDH